MIAAAVYALCTLTSALCAALLLRHHRRAGGRLLWWSGISFAAMAVANALVFVDLVMLPTETDLLLVRAFTMLVSAVLLVYGLVWEGD
jgi:hypothetical protein